jgi:hypothetical protein
VHLSEEGVLETDSSEQGGEPDMGERAVNLAASPPGDPGGPDQPRRDLRPCDEQGGVPLTLEKLLEAADIVDEVFSLN